MDTRIIGNATLSCNSCGKTHALDAEKIHFEFNASEDNNLEGDSRYQAAHQYNCPNCGQAISIGFEVWEFPAGATNYCYHSEQGASRVQCEFSIEYYHADGGQEQSDVTRSLQSFSEDNDDEVEDDYEGRVDYDGSSGNFHQGALDDFEVAED